MRIVMKFGGTSVGDGPRVQAAAGLVAAERRRGHTIALVVSAMSGVTNALIRAAREAAAGDLAIASASKLALAEQHRMAIEAAVRDPAAQAALLARTEQLLAEFESLVHAVGVLGELTARALDTIAAFGERLVVPLFAQCLRELGVPAEAVDAAELIVTEGQFGAAHPRMAETEARACARLQPLFAAGTVPVITGFIGATPAGLVTTLGRGGSDYSATILGAALDAAEVWIWTDVDGVMSADPRVVPSARTLPEISYAEAAELAYFGAKVLHPKTLRPAAAKGIPVRILNTFNPAHPGTLIVREPRRNGHTVQAISEIRKQSLITVEGHGMQGVPGVAARLFATVAREGASVLMISQSSSEQNICLVLETEAAARAVAALEREFALERMEEIIDCIVAQDQIAVVAVVGAGMKGTPGISARVFGAVGRPPLAGVNPINVIAIAQGSSEYNISLVVDERDADNAVRAIHAAFE